MKLLLSSGRLSKKDSVLTEIFVSMLPKNCRVAYVPSRAEGSQAYFEEFSDVLAHYGVTHTDSFFIDVQTTLVDHSKLLDYDAIFLSGGNTFYFLKHIKESGVFSTVKQFAMNGGVVAGTSAGAMIMTPRVDTAALGVCGDANDVGLIDTEGLGLVSFEFLPHYSQEHGFPDLPSYAKEQANAPIFACDDMSGIVVNDSAVTFCGNVHCFLGANHFAVSKHR